MNHIINEVKKNVTYNDILKMTIEEEKDLLSRVNKLPDNYKKNAYTEITNIITPNLKYDEIVKMSNDEIIKAKIHKNVDIAIAGTIISPLKLKV